MAASPQAHRLSSWALLPAERLVLLWLLCGAALLAFAGRGIERRYLHLAAHLGAALGLVILARLCEPRSRWMAARRLLPLLLAPLVYGEISVLNTLLHGGHRFDAVVLGWERWLFLGHDLAVELRGWLPWRPLGEFLAFAYFSYYFLGLALWVALAARRRWRELDETLTVVALVFVGCQLWFVLFPVAGPYHALPPPDPHALGWVFPPLVHRVLDLGSSVGTAFPSSHCAVAGALLLMALRHDRLVGRILLVLVPALTVGAVQGGFHYGVDALAGWAWCLLLVPLGLRLHRRWASAVPSAPRPSFSRPG